MHPAPSVIVFTVLSGLGFGFLALLGLGVPRVAGATAFVAWGLGYGLAVAGLVASTFHLGQPRRALLAFTQWRSSWLSREAWASLSALAWLAPVALSDWLGFGWPGWWAWIGAALCVLAVVATGMIYAQIRAVPRWHHPVTPALFLGFAATGGSILAGLPSAPALCAALAALLVLAFREGDAAFGRAGQTMGTATGLGGIGRVDVFEQPHTGGNYLMREMIHVVGRRHAARLRVIAVGGAAVAPAVVLLVVPGWPGQAVAIVLHVAGAFAARWLFFAEAEHVVGLYYGRR
ncbi:MAG: dimethyl sulfoxide reductase anchor subunit [Paracoccaceae bacterium]|nr:MAG: dimethyl sulfoxide reductase anchor subunit [Paracoccaceae bacterium]